MAQLKLITFKSPTCAACRGMDRAKTLEKFAEAHPEVFVGQILLADEDPVTDSEKEAEKLAQKHKVRSLPTIFFVSDKEVGGWTGKGTVLKKEVGAMNLADLEACFAKAERKFNKLNELDDDEDDADLDEDDTDEDESDDTE